MAFPASFRLGLDITNVVGPLVKTILLLGSVDIFQEIKRSKSDGITGLHLEALIGRHRVAEYMKENFQRIVAQSHQTIFSRILQNEGFVLEAGAGPSVRQALTDSNPAWLLMIIQMSVLGFSNEQESLAQAITTVTSEMLHSSAVDKRQDLDYVSILAALSACQQQTANFVYVDFFERTEKKIHDAIRNS
ncbi:hypothetical protein N7478_009185 [Penicillium angulare]|uniref:uncharacterized protein n=1 Tax=Penicillium angulare TaxID=116970 RepID=UPI002540E411|nr:uncharacterized protein N7478_009185 [Penicillium angulare]KAJ5274060.1 hypothetical protein N7478_009185 [Penicillium angulare]